MSCPMAVIPSSCVIVIVFLQISIGFNHKGSLIVSTIMFMSLGTTILATALIIYRIHRFSKDGGSRSNRYNFTIKVLVESGALYAATLLVDCILLVSRGLPFSADPEREGISFWVGILTPVAVSSGHFITKMYYQ